MFEVQSGTRSRAPLATAILERLTQRLSPEDFSEWLGGSHADLVEEESEGYRIRFLLEGLFVYVCENSDSPGGTLSAVRNVLERYRKTLVDVVASCEEGGQILTECIMTCLHQQPALLNIFLDTVMRYGIMHPFEAANWLCRDLSEATDGSNPAVDAIHISNAATNHWVWAYVQTSVNRCLDMMKVAFARRSAHVKAARLPVATTDEKEEPGSKRLKATEDAEQLLEVTIPDDINDIVDSAAEGCQEAYAVIVSNLLLQIASRSASLVEEGKEEEEEIKELDGKLITAVSLVHQVRGRQQMLFLTFVNIYIFFQAHES